MAHVPVEVLVTLEVDVVCVDEGQEALQGSRAEGSVRDHDSPQPSLMGRLGDGDHVVLPDEGLCVCEADGRQILFQGEGDDGGRGGLLSRNEGLRDVGVLAEVAVEGAAALGQ